jgi:DNA-binding XRE family transcriptional regulator
LAQYAVDKHLGRIEKHVHAFLAAYRTSGEWFRISLHQEDLEHLVSQALEAITEEDAARQRRALTLEYAFLEERRVVLEGIGERIRDLRLSLGMDEEEFGQAIGASFGGVQSMEKGNGRLHIFYIINMSKTFGVSADYLLGLSDVGPPVRAPQRASRRRAVLKD